MKRKRYTYPEVYDLFEKEHYKLLTKNIKNVRQHVEFICNNGHLYKMQLYSFLNGCRCGTCFKKPKHTYSEIKELFKKEGWKLLSLSYKNNKSPLKVSCPNNHISYPTLGNFKKGGRCFKCTVDTYRYTLEKVREIFKNKNWKLLSNKYINALMPLKIICNKGHKTTISGLGNFLNGHGCMICRNINLSGKNNYWWNPNKTNEERLLNRKLKENTNWIKEVLKRDNYTCQCCGKKGTGHNLNAHHLEGWHWCKKLRFEVSNGITLCKDCHELFHKLFKRHFNTSEQFYQFLRKS